MERCDGKTRFGEVYAQKVKEVTETTEKVITWEKNPKGLLVLLDTSSKIENVAVGDNVGYVLGKVVAIHKVSSVSTSSSENESIESTGVGENKTLIVKSLADEGTSVVTADTYLGREVLSIPQVGEWIRNALDCKWAIVAVAVVLIIIGCIPRKKNQKEDRLKATTGA